jgi:4-carboxymuconolactone decarboxylase
MAYTKSGDDGTRIAAIAPEDYTEVQAAAVADALGNRGFLPSPFQIWLHSPALAERIGALGTYLTTSSSLSKREYEIAVVVVARRLNSPYVYEAHLRGAEKAGNPPEVIGALREGRVPEFATARERAVYEIAATSEDSEPASDAIFDAAVAALGRDGLADLLGLIGYYTAVSVAMKLHRVPAGAR